MFTMRCLSRDIHIKLYLNKMYLHYLFQVILYMWHYSLMWHKFINNRRCSILCQWYTMERLDVSDEKEPITSPLSLDIPHTSADDMDIRRIWCDKYCKLWNMCELWKILANRIKTNPGMDYIRANDAIYQYVRCAWKMIDIRVTKGLSS